MTTPNGGPDTWRHLFPAGGLGLLIAPLARFFMPESVRWYGSHGEVDKAEKIVAELGLERCAADR